MPTSDVARDPKAVPAVPNGSSQGSRSIWWSRRAVGLHVALVVAVPGFLALFWWQVERVRQGNTLSWAYVFEWPFFTGYAVYMWWKLVHDPIETPRPAAPRDVVGAVGARDHSVEEVGETVGETHETGETHEVGEDDEELAAYNRYLAELHTSGRRKRW